MQLLTELEETKEQMLAYFDLTERDLRKRYAPEKWSVKVLLNHIVDAETVMYDRIRRAIAEQPKPVIWGFQQDNWAKHLNYETFPLSLNKNLFIAVRENIKHLASQYYKQVDQFQFIHSETGLRTLKAEFEKIVWHCEHHMLQIELALTKEIY